MLAHCERYEVWCCRMDRFGVGETVIGLSPTDGYILQLVALWSDTSILIYSIELLWYLK